MKNLQGFPVNFKLIACNVMYFSIAISTCLPKVRNYGNFRHACNPHDNYMHGTGNTLQHRDSLHFLWGKHLQCSVGIYCLKTSEISIQWWLMFIYMCAWKSKIWMRLWKILSQNIMLRHENGGRQEKKDESLLSKQQFTMLSYARNNLK